ncbi:MAG: nodulation protein NfeD [Proteobacteria bacterium]|nr:nodulation protein NfeD [Pseudomonadota bacterium]
MQQAPVLVLQVDGAIGPVAVDRVQRTLDRAARERAALVVLEIDTPGGLDTAMRGIVQAILASPVPVACYVAPPGARAASAGTYILYACHVAAMAPATNVGAATPVAVGMPGIGTQKDPKEGKDGAADKTQDTMGAKRVQDASAYLRSLAQLRGRDTAWADQAVKDSASLAANEALARHVIDLVAADRADLLRQLDGREIRLGGIDKPDGPTAKLATARAPVLVMDLNWRDRLLGALSDPSLALLLLMVGVYGLLFEFMSPGFVAPGVIGGVCLLLALWGLQMLPINYTGLALILLGIGFFVAEAFVPSYGALGAGGIAAFVFGALLLVDSELPGFGVPLPFVATLAGLFALALVVLVRMALKAHAKPVVSGARQLLGTLAEVIEFDPGPGEGWALLNGERWRIHAAGHALAPGQLVQVAHMDGLRLEVHPVAGTHAPARPQQQQQQQQQPASAP